VVAAAGRPESPASRVAWDAADWLDAWALLSETNPRLKKDQPAEKMLDPPLAMVW
jgi:hypothetical protein